MASWDACEVLDPDTVTAKLQIGEYTEGPVALGTNEGDFPGSIKCNSFYDYPADIEIPENSSKEELSGWLYQVLMPYGTPEEAAEGFQTLYDGAAEAVRERPEDEQSVDESIEGDWDQGAILASVGVGSSFRAIIQKGPYVVFIEVGGDPDPGIMNGLSYKDIETYDNPTYEYTPMDLADWMQSDYLPAVQETITAKLEG
ncbi:hypothetical protein [Glycomyces paridis]|uniref:Uncharacterized protein n=1 Tax=Glycomyces paridis TaxID=2126555 RepID=A0A4S8PHN3_9ACTN|nr:hypothetical protein [Glycomyces paridis]THV30107.1 hypothetical protein E9998_06935 [Glycomyces paridis]